MRRTVIAGLATIAVIFGVSVLLVDRLTSPDTTPRALTRQDAIETPARDASPPVSPPPALVAAERAPPDAPAAPPPRAEPVEVAPEVAERLAASSSQVRVAGELTTLQARITSRCGSMRLRSATDAADPTRDLTGQAVILLDLQAADGQARVTGSKILSQGAMRASLTACAQHALRNQVFPASAGASGSLTVPVVLSMAEGSP